MEIGSKLCDQHPCDAIVAAFDGMRQRGEAITIPMVHICAVRFQERTDGATVCGTLERIAAISKSEIL